VLLDISATYENRSTLLDTLSAHGLASCSYRRSLWRRLSILDDAAAVFDSGADKVTVNSAALADRL